MHRCQSYPLRLSWSTVKVASKLFDLWQKICQTRTIIEMTDGPDRASSPFCTAGCCEGNWVNSSLQQHVIKCLALSCWPETNNSLAAHHGGPSVNSSAAATMPHCTQLQSTVQGVITQCTNYIWRTASPCCLCYTVIIHYTAVGLGLMRNICQQFQEFHNSLRWSLSMDTMQLQKYSHFRKTVLHCVLQGGCALHREVPINNNSSAHSPPQ